MNELDDLFRRVENLERRTKQIRSNPAPTVPIFGADWPYDAPEGQLVIAPVDNAGAPIAPPLVSQYVIEYPGAITSDPLNVDTWYGLNLTYTWHSFSDSSITMQMFSGGIVSIFGPVTYDTSNTITDGYNTGIGSWFLSDNPISYFCVPYYDAGFWSLGGGGAVAYQYGHLVNGFVQNGVSCTKVGDSPGGYSDGQTGTLIALTGPYDQPAFGDTTTVSMRVNVPSASPVNDFGASECRLVDFRTGDGAGLDSGVFFSISAIG